VSLGSFANKGANASRPRADETVSGASVLTNVPLKHLLILIKEGLSDPDNIQGRRGRDPETLRHVDIGSDRKIS
jgi:hypothetical protein